jgi:hypothetical protein
MVCKYQGASFPKILDYEAGNMVEVLATCHPLWNARRISPSLYRLCTALIQWQLGSTRPSSSASPHYRAFSEAKPAVNYPPKDDVMPVLGGNWAS